MSENLIPYENTFDGLTRLYLTGKCKRKTIIHKFGEPTVLNYVQHRVHILGIPLWTRWVDKGHIVWREVKEEIYECET